MTNPATTARIASRKIVFAGERSSRPWSGLLHPDTRRARFATDTRLGLGIDRATEWATLIDVNRSTVSRWEDPRVSGGLSGAVGAFYWIASQEPFTSASHVNEVPQFRQNALNRPGEDS